VTTPTQWNLADMFEAVADAVPDRPALVCGDRRLTYRELDERSTRLANHLAAAGVGPGDHVGLYLYNGSEYIEGYFAAYKLRAVPINVNYRYVESELRYLFDNADLVGLVHGREFIPRIAAVKPECPKLVACVAVEDGSGEDLGAIGAVEYEAALAAASPERSFPPRSEEDLYILYTGGTTGMPKGVMWTQKDFFLSTIGPLLTLGGAGFESPAAVVEAAVAGGGALVSFPIAPLMHGAALWVAIMVLLGGNKLVLTSQRKMDAHGVWSIIEQEKVMTASLVGDAMARPLVEALDDEGASYDVSSLFVIGSGGAILSPAVKAKLAERLPNVMVVDSIGASETGYQGTFASADDQGRPRFVMGDHTTVLDDDGNPVEPGGGVVGRLARGGYVPIGYYKDPEKTASVFVESGGKRWVLPGDMAMVEADGTITLLGRGSVSINTGGEKVFPEEVESALKSHPDVFDVVVVGVPDDRWGERVAAVVKARPGSSPTVDELATHAREHIAGYKVPREVHLVDEVVRSPSGKADYRWAKATATGKS
jgi:acyl-CoA synthetase (AMP-forming)/AMP-acid ligase II